MIDLEQKIKKIKRKRKELGLTQKDLSSKSDVSQSFIAKLESGKLEPSYSKLKKVEDLLKKMTDEGPTAEDLMNSPVQSVKKDDEVKKAVKIMRGNEFSQLPVMDGDTQVGCIKARNVMLAAEEKDSDSIKEVDAEEIMDPAFPEISPQMSARIVKELLREREAVLVKREGNIIGIVDSDDFLGKS